MLKLKIISLDLDESARDQLPGPEDVILMLRRYGLPLASPVLTQLLTQRPGELAELITPAHLRSDGLAALKERLLTIVRVGETLGGPSLQECLDALTLLSLIAPPGTLKEFLGHRSLSTRAHAAEIIGPLATAEDLPDLIPHLNAMGTEDGLLAIINAIGRLGKEEHFSILISTFKEHDKNSEIREAVADAIAQIGRRNRSTTIEKMKRALQRGTANDRICAAMVLMKLDATDPEIVEQLDTLKEDSDHLMKLLATEAWLKLNASLTSRDLWGLWESWVEPADQPAEKRGVAAPFILRAIGKRGTLADVARLVQKFYWSNESRPAAVEAIANIATRHDCLPQVCEQIDQPLILIPLAKHLLGIKENFENA
ncbi:MAG: hypothetical protein HQ596_01805 [Candidatus Saganbacteria bacterium]|nr:hypothetical protein [Candidatus Saganbacteria bacterium]